MKLLIDGYNKQTRSIAANIRFTKNLQVLVYDPEKINVHGMDLVILQNAFTPEIEFNGGVTAIPCDYENDFKVVCNFSNKGDIYDKNMPSEFVEYTNNVNEYNGSWIKSTLNIEEALEWCDCYACTDSVEWDLITTKNYDETAQKYVDKLNRLQRIKDSGKKVYLSHRLDKIFAKESKYDNMFNTVIDKKALEHMKYLANGVINAQSNETDIKLVVGTYSGSGKLSLSLKMKEWYDTHNERTGIIFTENTADIFNSDFIEKGELDKSLIINASREWCDLTIDEWIEYVQYAVAYLEQRGCKHILLQGQGTYGLHKMNKYYINENSSTMNISNIILEYAIGCSSVAIACCVNMIDRLYDYYRYFTMNDIKVTDIYFSVYNHAVEWKDSKIELCNGVGYLPINDTCTNADICSAMNNMYTLDNDINFYTSDYLSMILENKQPYNNLNYLEYSFNEDLIELNAKLQNICDNFCRIGKFENFKCMLKNYFEKVITPIFEAEVKTE